jgi:hypothetical protein
MMLEGAGEHVLCNVGYTEEPSKLPLWSNSGQARRQSVLMESKIEPEPGSARAMLTRRAATRAATLATLSLKPISAGASQKPLVVMTSYPDGGHCSMWRREVQDVWKQTSQFQAVSYQEIYASSAKQLEYKEVWPRDLLWLRSQFIDEWRKWTVKDQASYGATPATDADALRFSPRFFVAQDQKLIETAAGIGGWKAYIDPALSRVTGVGSSPR